MGTDTESAPSQMRKADVEVAVSTNAHRLLPRPAAAVERHCFELISTAIILSVACKVGVGPILLFRTVHGWFRLSVGCDAVVVKIVG